MCTRVHVRVLCGACMHVRVHAHVRVCTCVWTAAFSHTHSHTHTRMRTHMTMCTRVHVRVRLCVGRGVPMRTQERPISMQSDVLVRVCVF